LRRISYTLIADGSSDKSLLPIIDWAIKQHLGSAVDYELNRYWADLSFLEIRPCELKDRIKQAFRYYPSDFIVVHRDAERESPQSRINEIRSGVADSELGIAVAPVIPIRMLEAWLLIDENAIRNTSGNDRSEVNLDLPDASRLEGIADPKRLLFDKIKLASGLKGRNLDRLNLYKCRSQLSMYIEDFSTLRRLSAFVGFENSLHTVLDVLLSK